MDSRIEYGITNKTIIIKILFGFLNNNVYVYHIQII